MADKVEWENMTFDERLGTGCGDLYLSRDEALRVAKVLLDIVLNLELEVSSIEFLGYRISAEADAFEGGEDGLFLIKEKIQ